MIIDTSALLAVLFNEPEAFQIARVISIDKKRMLSAANFLESSILTLVRYGEDGLRDLDLLISKCKIEIAIVSIRNVTLARKAYSQYGKGRHPAALNFGDCFAYALAKETGEPLLFKGQDFDKTDLNRVVY